uniref:CCHC-type domain-containing protein n=1 Tax=Quercus lobata TaxID=97700 RepID=A0A7N2MUV0_QUELO
MSCDAVKTVSYRDTLIGDIPGAFAQAFSLDRADELDDDSDFEIEDITEGLVEVKLSKETKSRIRAPWSKALIVKVFGRSVGYNYLTFKLNDLWKPVARMDCVDLSKDFFLIKFSDEADYDKALEASFNSVVVWVRLPKLPIEFYDNSVLLEIGKAIGPVLRVDSYTASGAKGSYARLCLQIDLTKPLINTIKVGQLRQKVMFEGVSSLCYCCGRMGHKQESCNYHIHPSEREVEKEPIVTSPVSQTTQQQKPQYGEWMLVTKKRQGVRNGRGHATRLSNPQTEGEASGAKGDLSNSKTFLFKASTSQKVVSREGSLHYTPKGQMEALGNGACDRCDRSVQLEEPVNKGSKTSYLPRDKKGTSAKGKRTLNRPLPNARLLQYGVGHKREACPFLVHEGVHVDSPEMNTSTPSPPSPTRNATSETYGTWTLVSRRKDKYPKSRAHPEPKNQPPNL